MFSDIELSPAFCDASLLLSIDYWILGALYITNFSESKLLQNLPGNPSSDIDDDSG